MQLTFDVSKTILQPGTPALEYFLSRAIFELPCLDQVQSCSCHPCLLTFQLNEFAPDGDRKAFEGRVIDLVVSCIKEAGLIKM